MCIISLVLGLFSSQVGLVGFFANDCSNFTRILSCSAATLFFVFVFCKIYTFLILALILFVLTTWLNLKTRKKG